jgi:diguanylate cyclase (GGDEF)-like protein
MLSHNRRPMKLRIAGRHDSLLLAGFAFALLVVFQRSVQYLFSVANDVEKTYGVALIPALLILTIMFVFHLYANRREVKAEAATAAREAEMARARTRELEQLMTFGQALSRALTMEAIDEAIWRHLPVLAGGSDIWMVVRRDGEWVRVTDRAHARWPDGEIEAVADAIIDCPPEDLARPDGIQRGTYICFAIAAGDRTAGVIGLKPPTAPAEVRRTIGTAATLVGIALRNVQLFCEVRDHGLRDALTGCLNRAHGLELLDAEIARARRSDLAVSVLMFDVDEFKHINDAHGHLCGDEVLAAVGYRLRMVLRRSDLRCRYGGDEFLVVLPETPAAGAMRVAEWVRGEIEQVDVPGRDAFVKPTVSIGVATWSAVDGVDGLLERADRAMYAAKAAGRNCVRTATLGRRLEVVPQPARGRLDT